MNSDELVKKHSITYVAGLYIKLVTDTRSSHTARTYKNGLDLFLHTLKDHKIDPEKYMVEDLSEDSIAWFADDLKYYAPASERLYLTAAKGFFEYLAAERLSTPNLPRLNLLIRHRSRRTGVRLPQFPKDEIEVLIKYAINIASSLEDSQAEKLRNYRDKAFILVLADTGMRVHEACNLRRGDVDWLEGKAIVIGKGNQQAVIRFSKRSISAVKDYINLRAELDGSSGRPIGSLPVFARHDKGAGKKIKPITTATGRNIINQRVSEAINPNAARTITPHSLRHYFVTTILQASGNLKLAQELARHKSIAVTQRYAHLSNDELDKGYHEIFEDS